MAHTSRVSGLVYFLQVDSLRRCQPVMWRLIAIAARGQWQSRYYFIPSNKSAVLEKWPFFKFCVPLKKHVMVGRWKIAAQEKPYMALTKQPCLWRNFWRLLPIRAESRPSEDNCIANETGRRTLLREMHRLNAFSANCPRLWRRSWAKQNFTTAEKRRALQQLHAAVMFSHRLVSSHSPLSLLLKWNARSPHPAAFWVKRIFLWPFLSPPSTSGPFGNHRRGIRNYSVHINVAELELSRLDCGDATIRKIGWNQSPLAKAMKNRTTSIQTWTTKAQKHEVYGILSNPIKKYQWL